MGYYIDIVTDHSVLVEKFADDKSVNKSLPQETMDNDYFTYIFPSNVLTLTSKFFRIYFANELASVKTKEDFKNRYKFIFLYPNPTIDMLIDTLLDSYYRSKIR